MTLNLDIRRDRLVVWGRFILNKFRRTLYTTMPGVIVSYNASTRRASVQGAVHQSRGQTHVPRAIIPNVPVVFPSGGGFRIHFPLQAGDPVLLVYSCKSLAFWKKTHRPGPARKGLGLVEMDAMAIPGFGPAGSWSPAESGMVFQKSDDEYIRIDNDRIKLNIDAASIELHEGRITFEGMITYGGATSSITFGGSVDFSGATVTGIKKLEAEGSKVEAREDRVDIEADGASVELSGGNVTIEPDTGGSVTIQSGSTSIVVSDGSIRLVGEASTYLEIDGSDVTINAPSGDVTITGQTTSGTW